MTTGTVKTQGTKLYFANEASEVLQVLCATGIQGLGGAADRIEKTCLTSTEKEYDRGQLDPETVTIPINFIPNSASHQVLNDLRDSGDTISWMIVLSDQAAAPTTLDSDDRLISPGATSAEFLGYVADFNIDIATNEIVRATLSVQRSGAVDWDFPTATQ